MSMATTTDIIREDKKMKSTHKLDIHIVLDTLADAARGRPLDPETCQVIESIAREYDHKDFTADDVEALYRCGWQPPRPQGVKEALDYFSERYPAELESGDLCPHEFEKNLSIVIAAARTGHDLPEKLPCDVTIGAGIFRRGVPTRLVLEKIKWWQDMVDKGETPPVNRRPTADCTCTVKERYSGCRIECDVPQREDGEAEQHFDDVAVYVLAKAMKSKLAQKRSEGRGGWQSPDECSQELLSKLLREHVEKGDPVDVANFCMMLFNRGECIEQIPNVGEVVTKCSIYNSSFENMEIAEQEQEQALRKAKQKRMGDFITDPPEVIYAWQHGDDEPLNGMWIDTQDPCNLGVRYILATRADRREALATSDLTDEDFKQIYVEWKNQCGMNAFLTQRDETSIKWVFECLEANGLFIMKGGS